MVGISQTADDTFSVRAPGPEAFRIVVETLHEVGDVTFVDRHAGLAQALVTFVDGPSCYLHIATQGRAHNGETDVFVTIESLERRPAPEVDAVTRFVVDAVRRSATAAPTAEGS